MHLTYSRKDLSELELDRIGPSVSVLRLRGEHDRTTVSSLRNLLDRALAERCGVVLDLTEATFIDSSVLAALVDADRRARREHLAFAVSTGAMPGSSVGRTIEITGLASVLKICSGSERAIAFVRERLA